MDSEAYIVNDEGHPTLNPKKFNVSEFVVQVHFEGGLWLHVVDIVISEVGFDQFL